MTKAEMQAQIDELELRCGEAEADLKKAMDHETELETEVDSLEFTVAEGEEEKEQLRDQIVILEWRLSQAFRILEAFGISEREVIFVENSARPCELLGVSNGHRN